MTRAPESAAETDVQAVSSVPGRADEASVGPSEASADAEAPAGPATRRPEARDTLRWLLWLALLRLAVGAAVAMYGLAALSDDDYARVTIAQRFAAKPRFDPSGTSWLPFPFWITGAAMKVLDPSLDVARLAAGILAVAGTWLLFAAGRAWGFSQKRAFAAAALATLTPAVAVLGNMTVPEFPTAALSAFGIVVATAPPSAARSAWWSDKAPFFASAAMLGATLSRYEAWPVAPVVAVVLWRRQRTARLWKRAAFAILPILGPLIWILHNQSAHGDAFSFVRRVSSYRAALGAGDASHLGTYWLGVIGGSPAVLFALVWLVVARYRSNGRVEAQERLSRFGGWAASAAALVAFLFAGQLMGGAPTHHPERALLLIWLLGVLASVDLASRARPPLRFTLFVVLLAVIDYRRELSDRGAGRQAEERVGTQLRALVGRGERVFVATNDYGYFAVTAAFGRPDDVIVDSQDPRLKSTLTLLGDPWNAVTRLRAENASWLVAPSSFAFPLALQERMRDGPLVIYELTPGDRLR